MAFASPNIRLPQQPAIIAALKSCIWLSPDSRIEQIDHETARDRIGKTVIPIVCHAGSTARRLGAAPFPALDILELFAFTHPAQFTKSHQMTNTIICFKETNNILLYLSVW